MERANGGVCSTWSRKFVPFDVCIMDIMIYINGFYMYMYSYCCRIYSPEKQGPNIPQLHFRHKVDSFLRYNSRYLLVFIHFYPMLIVFFQMILVWDMWLLGFKKFILRRRSFIIRNIKLVFRMFCQCVESKFILRRRSVIIINLSCYLFWSCVLSKVSVKWINTYSTIWLCYDRFDLWFRSLVKHVSIYVHGCCRLLSGGVMNDLLE
jgi:hypothetical protein